MGDPVSHSALLGRKAANIVSVDDGVYHSHSHELWSFSDKLAFVLVRFLFIQDFTFFVAFPKFSLEYSCSTVLC